MPDGPVPPQWVRGKASRQAHADLPPGTVEEEHGRDGFGGPASHLYRFHPPTGWTGIEGPLRPRAFDTAATPAGPGGPPPALLENADVRISFWSLPAGTPPWFFRDADGDVVYFVHSGHGTLETEYGPLPLQPGDYLVVPRATTHRVAAATPVRLLVVEALEGRVALPDRGLLGRHALFDPAVVEVPEPCAVREAGEFEVRIRRNGALTSVTYPFHPFDVVGWKGDLAPMRVNVADFRPVVSARYHLPPSAHTTFTAPGFVVATFAPRPLESDPDVLRLPFFHRNVDVDEVIFYHRGRFFSRAGIGEGMMTLHPAGIHHGPQPQAVERSRQAGPGGATDEVAVNIDARRPLALSAAAERLEVTGYSDSWKEDPPG